MELFLETQFWSLLTKCIIFNVNYCNDQSVHANITGNANQISTLKLPQPTAPSHNLWFPYVSLLLQYIIHANSNSIFQWNHSLFHFHDFVCLMFSCLFGLFFLDSFLLFGFIIFPDNNTPCDTKNKSFWVIWMDGCMDGCMKMNDPIRCLWTILSDTRYVYGHFDTELTFADKISSLRKSSLLFQSLNASNLVSCWPNGHSSCDYVRQLPHTNQNISGEFVLFKGFFDSLGHWLFTFVGWKHVWMGVCT